MSISANSSVKSEKSGSSVLLLCMFLGGLGGHRFYVGKIGTALLMLLTFGGFGIWTLVDLITIAQCNFTDKNDHYVEFTRSTSSSPAAQVLKVLGIILAGFILFTGLICTLVMYATAGLTDAARNQLSALREHDYAKAYSYTSKQFQEGTSLEDFTKFVKNYPVLNDNKDSTFNERSMKNGMGTISGTVEAADGTSAPIVYELIKENGGWKILSVELNPGKPRANKTISDDANAEQEQPESSTSEDDNE